MTTTRFYKGNRQCEILIKGKRKGKRGPITYLVRFEDGSETVTIPRLLWTHHALSTNNAKT